MSLQSQHGAEPRALCSSLVYEQIPFGDHKLSLLSFTWCGRQRGDAEDARCLKADLEDDPEAK